jgi:hypothetical protein
MNTALRYGRFVESEPGKTGRRCGNSIESSRHSGDWVTIDGIWMIIGFI